MTLGQPTEVVSEIASYWWGVDSGNGPGVFWLWVGVEERGRALVGEQRRKHVGEVRECEREMKMGIVAPLWWPGREGKRSMHGCHQQ